MNTLFHRSLTALTALLLTVIGASAYDIPIDDVYDFSVDGICYNIVSGGVEVTYGLRYIGDITIPAKVTYNSSEYVVVGVGEEAAKGLPVTSLTFEGPVQYIGKNAFRGCAGLVSVSHCGIRSIGYYAFAETNLTKFDFSEGLTEICAGAFSKAKLTEVSLPIGLETIGACSFYMCPLTSVYLPEGFKEIGQAAFCNTNIRNITLPSTLEIIWYNAFGSSKLEDITVSPNVKFLDEAVFQNCSSLTNVELNCEVQNEGLLSYVNSFFMFSDSQDIETVIIAGNITLLGGGFFRNVKIKKLFIGENVKYVTNWTFIRSSAEDVYFMSQIPPEVKSYQPATTMIADYFGGDGSQKIFDCVNVHIPEGSKEAYLNSRLLQYYFPANVRIIEGDLSSSIDEMVVGDDTEITVAEGRIIADGVVEVYATDGRMVGRGLCDDLPALTPGLYIVRTPSAAKKIIVR